MFVRLAGAPLIVAMTLFCRVCDSPNDFDRNWVNEHDACSACGAEGQWRTLNEPKKVYELSLNDERMLRSMRIDPKA